MAPRARSMGSGAGTTIVAAGGRAAAADGSGGGGGFRRGTDQRPPCCAQGWCLRAQASTAAKESDKKRPVPPGRAAGRRASWHGSRTQRTEEDTTACNSILSRQMLAAAGGSVTAACANLALRRPLRCLKGPLPLSLCLWVPLSTAQLPASLSTAFSARPARVIRRCCCNAPLLTPLLAAPRTPVLLSTFGDPVCVMACRQPAAVFAAGCMMVAVRAHEA